MSCYQKFYTNQIHSSSLLCQLATMWKSQVLCDAIIKSGTVNIKAHRVVLVAACPMLQSMENAAVGSHLEVRLASDIKQDSINAFLQYLYEGFMMLTEENCKDVEKIARLLQVDSVIKCCADFYKCLSTKTGNTDLNDPYKYTFHDMVEFRHVRSSDIQKTYQSRLVKRTSDFPRPASPNSKRQKIHRPSSPFTGTHKPDDTISMSHGYNNASSNPWERVPWLPASKRGHHNTPQPGVIDIVEDSLELVQTNPGSKGKGDRPQESVSVGVASSINSSSDVQVVDIVEPSGSTPFISSNTAGISGMSQNDASVSSDRNTNSSPASHNRGSDKQSSSANRDPLERVMQSTQFSTPSHQRSDADTSISFSRSSESYSYSSPSLSLSGPRLMPNSRSFAAGSPLQSGASHGQRVSGLQPPPLSRGPKPVTHTEGSGDKDYSDRDSDDQLTDKPPDLSIVKIEAVGAESTGGLDMSVDTLDDKVHLEIEHEDGSETEHDQSTDWIPEEMSNEASNVSTDQNSTWYMGHSQGKGHGRLKGTKWHSVGMPSPKQAHSPMKLSSNLKSKGSYGPEVVLIDDNQPYLHFSPVDSSFVAEDSFQHDRKSDPVVKLSMYGTDVVTDPDKTLSLLSEDDFIKLESIVGSIDTVPVHFIASLQGKQKICLLCKFLGRKTNDGALSVRTRSKCLQCDIPLCKGMPRNCFPVFHKFFQLSKYPDLKW